MQKNIVKTESVAEFIARGGKISKLASRGERKTKPRQVAMPKLEDVDMTHLPAALKIKYGVR